MAKYLLVFFVSFWHIFSYANDDCANAIELTPGTTCTLTTGSFSGTTISGTAPACAPTASQDVWYKFTATDATMSIYLNDVSGLNHGFEIYQGSCNSNPWQCVNANPTYTIESYFNNNFIPGQLYYVRVFNVSAGFSTASFGICIRKYPTPTNDLCTNAIELTPNATCVLTTGTFSGAMMNGGTPACGTSSSQDVWYKFTATDSTMSVYLNDVSGLNHGFEIYQGGCNGTVWQCVNVNSTYNIESYFNNNFIPGQVYYVRVFNALATLSTANFGICVRKYPTPTNDLCANAIELTPNATCVLTTGTFSGAMMNGGTPACGTSSSQDVWYKFTATDSTMSVYLNDVSGLNHGFEIYQGGCNGTIWQCVNANSSYNIESYFYNNFIPGQVYYVRVFNALATLSTANFGICIRKYPTPVNDICANATELTPNATCVLTTGTFSGAMMNGGTPSCGTSSSQDVWYKFTATDSTMSVYLNDVSGLNHGFEIYQGGCNGTVWQCVNANSSYNIESYFYNNFIPGQVYYVRVFNALATLSTANFGICVRKYPTPVNDICANATTLSPNTSCTFTTGTFSGAMMNGGTASCGTASSQDVWYKFTATDSTMSVYLNDVSGLNHGFEIYQGGCNGTVWQCVNANSSYNIESYFNNNFIPGQVYYVRVLNVSSTLSTANFGICIRRYPTPANDLCANATLIIPSTSCAYTSGTFSGAMMNGGTPACGTAASQDVWYKFTATDPTMNIALNDVSGLNHGFEIYQGGCNGTVLQCVNANSSYNIESYFNNNFIPGQVYYVRVLNVSATLSTANFGICIVRYPSPSNDLCANALELTPNATCSYTGATFSGAMLDGGTPSCAPTASQDIWYKFIATTANMNVQISAASGLNHAFQVFEGSCSGTQLVCINQNGSNSTESAALTSLTVGQTYFIRVINASSSIIISNFGICVTGTHPTTCTPTMTITSLTNSICLGESVTFGTIQTHGGTSPYFQWKVNGTNVGTNSSSYTTSTLSNGAAVSCIMTSNAACASSINTTSNTITMNVSPTVTPAFTQIPTVCAGALLNLPTTSNNGITGTWSPAANNAATTTYAFTPNAGQCASGATSMTVTVSSGTIPTFTQIPAICVGGSFTLPTTSNNGVTGTWSPAINNTSTTTYTFTPTTAGQCQAATTMTVTVNNTIPAFTQVSTICAGSSFSLPTTSNNGVTGTWSPAINNMATTTYTFTPNAGQCASAITMTVNVNSNTVVPAFTQIQPICAGTSLTLPTTSINAISGTWSPAVNNMATTTYTFTPNAGQCGTSTTMTVTVNNNVTSTFTQIPAICAGTSFMLPTTSNNGITGTWSPAINNAATTTYTFTPNAGQCGSAATMTVTVNNSTTPTFTQVAPICAGGSFTLPTTSNNAITGTWSPAINNMATTTYTFTPNAGQCVLTKTMTVTVNNNTVPTFNQVAAICAGGSFTLPTTSTNAISGTWSPAVNNMATTTYTFTPNAGQCAATSTMTVTVNSTLTEPAFTQIPAICAGTSFTLPTTSNNGINGTWSPAINNMATTTYTFTPNAGQCASTKTMTVTVNNTLTQPAFTQIPAICAGTAFTLPTTSNNGINGTWSPAVNTAATTTYTFTPATGQCAATATMTVTVNNSTTPEFTQVPAICAGATFTLPTISNNGINGTWSPAVNTAATTTYTFTPTSGQCVGTATMTVVVNSVNAGITSQGNILTASAIGATYQWINCDGNQPINGATNPIFTPTLNGSYAVIVTQNGCSKTSNCIAINTLGVETLVQNGWLIYPNPATEQLFVELNETTEISILDLTGKTIQQETLKSGNNTVNVSSLTPGVYFIQAASGANVKFVKQ